MGSMRHLFTIPPLSWMGCIHPFIMQQNFQVVYDLGFGLQCHKLTNNRLQRSIYHDFADSSYFGCNIHYSDIISLSNCYVGAKYQFVIPIKVYLSIFFVFPFFNTPKLGVNRWFVVSCCGLSPLKQLTFRSSTNICINLADRVVQ